MIKNPKVFSNCADIYITDKKNAFRKESGYVKKDYNPI